MVITRTPVLAPVTALLIKSGLNQTLSLREEKGIRGRRRSANGKRRRGDLRDKNKKDTKAHENHGKNLEKEQRMVERITEYDKLLDNHPKHSSSM